MFRKMCATRNRCVCASFPYSVMQSWLWLHSINYHSLRFGSSWLKYAAVRSNNAFIPNRDQKRQSMCVLHTTFYWHTQQKSSRTILEGWCRIIFTFQSYVTQSNTHTHRTLLAQWVSGCSVGNTMPNGQEIEFISHESNRCAQINVFVIVCGESESERVKLENRKSNINRDWFVGESNRA